MRERPRHGRLSGRWKGILWSPAGVAPRGGESNPMFHVEHAGKGVMKRIYAEISVEEDLQKDEAKERSIHR